MAISGNSNAEVHKTSFALNIKNKHLTSMIALLVIDSAAVLTSLLFAIYFRGFVLKAWFPDLFRGHITLVTVENIWWFPLVLIVSLLNEKLYSKRLPFWKEGEMLFKSVTLAVFLSIVILFLVKTTDEVSRTLIVVIWFILICILPLFRYYGKLLLIRLEIWKRPVLIIGAGKTACLIASALKREKTMGYETIGILNDRGSEAVTAIHPLTCDIPILGSVADIDTVVQSAGVQDLFLAMPSLPSQHAVNLINHLQSMVSNLMIVPDLFGISLSGIEAQYFFDEQLLLLNIKNHLKSGYNRLAKRSFDLFVTLIAMIFCLPLLLIIAVAVKLDSKGPILFSGERIGQNGKLFKCHKFRTMFLDAAEMLEKHLSANGAEKAEWDRYRKLTKGDPRLTRVGRVIRRLSLDELPQLFNILCSEMSLVGPRPYMPEEKDLMGSWYEDIIIAKPGLTGLWQVSGRNLIDFTGRMKLGSWYIKNWSIWLDIVIILKTVRVVLKAEGAH